MPKKVNHIERRKLFAKAAIAVIAEKGLENLRLVDIAREAGLTTGSLTHYFNDKDQVIAAALDQVIETAFAQTGGNRTNDSLAAGLAAFLPLDEESHAASRVWIAFFSHSLGRPSLSDVHRLYYEEFVETLVTALKNTPALKARSSAELTDIANLLIALVDGLLVRATLDPKNWPAARQMQHLKMGIQAFTSPILETEELLK
ncbi:MAG: TetR/AcrR family transcriptional regulator [Parvibaculum sp.]